MDCIGDAVETINAEVDIRMFVAKYGYVILETFYQQRKHRPKQVPKIAVRAVLLFRGARSECHALCGHGDAPHADKAAHLCAKLLWDVTFQLESTPHRSAVRSVVSRYPILHGYPNGCAIIGYLYSLRGDACSTG